MLAYAAERCPPSGSSCGSGASRTRCPTARSTSWSRRSPSTTSTGRARPTCSAASRLLAPGGRFVLADVVVPEDPADGVTPLDEGFDLPARGRAAGVAGRGRTARDVAWAHRDLAGWSARCNERPLVEGVGARVLHSHPAGRPAGCAAACSRSPRRRSRRSLAYYVAQLLPLQRPAAGVRVDRRRDLARRDLQPPRPARDRADRRRRARPHGGRPAAAGDRHRAAADRPDDRARDGHRRRARRRRAARERGRRLGAAAGLARAERHAASRPTASSRRITGGAVALAVGFAVLPARPRAARRPCGAERVRRARLDARATRRGARRRRSRARRGGAGRRARARRGSRRARGGARHRAGDRPLRAAAPGIARAARALRRTLRQIDFAVRNTRVLARHSMRYSRARLSAPEGLAEALQRLGEAVWALAAAYDEPARAAEASALAHEAGALAREVFEAEPDLELTAILTQVRSLAADLMRAASCSATRPRSPTSGPPRSCSRRCRRRRSAAPTAPSRLRCRTWPTASACSCGESPPHLLGSGAAHGQRQAHAAAGNPPRHGDLARPRADDRVLPRPARPGDRPRRAVRRRPAEPPRVVRRARRLARPARCRSCSTRSCPQGVVGTGSTHHFALAVDTPTSRRPGATTCAARASSAPKSSTAGRSARSICAIPTGTSSRSRRAGRASEPAARASELRTDRRQPGVSPRPAATPARPRSAPRRLPSRRRP